MTDPTPNPFHEPDPAEDPDEVTELQLLTVIRDTTGLPAFCQQTGGGTATILIGDVKGVLAHNDPAWPRYRLALGPGWFAHRDWREGSGRFSLNDLYLGPDDQGEGGYVVVTSLDELRAQLVDLLAKPDWRDVEDARDLNAEVDAQDAEEAR